MLTLTFNELDEQWKVLDGDFPMGSGDTIKDAIASARIVTNDPIFTLNEELEYVEVSL